MKINHQISLFVVLCLLSLFPRSGSTQVVSKAPEDLLVVGSESILFESEVTQSTYKLYINLPDRYGVDPEQTYPVYYALDGNRTFGVTTQVYKGLLDDGFVPEMIIVGITYSGSNENPNLNRSRDLTPSNIVRIPTSGGASNFLKMLGEELIPFIDRQYRTDPSIRTLAGTSFAGLFTHYALFTQPTLFSRYIINNPTFWWEEDYAYQLEEIFYRKNKTLSARVMYLSGEFDALDKTRQMVTQVGGHGYQGMALDFREVANMGHLSGEAEAINQGMRFAFRLPEVKLPKEVLEEFCGTYQDGNYVREIIISEGDLHLVRQGQTTGAKIQATGPGTFALLGTYFDFHFKRNEVGKVSSFSYERDFDPNNIRIVPKVK